ncbi:hypothetical protein P7K49_006118 [Saguinus oedipus]|uniref:Uncharacterized protein n=1 Tax=Saguinus oedipus TaxID=9490 RepID=A0ABQ9W532_SAGOE|nr:hypothetical protein P7K49_006118 [Saguinus oedipus]
MRGWRGWEWPGREGRPSNRRWPNRAWTRRSLRIPGRSRILGSWRPLRESASICSVPGIAEDADRDPEGQLPRPGHPTRVLSSPGFARRKPAPPASAPRCPSLGELTAEMEENPVLLLSHYNTLRSTR